MSMIAAREIPADPALPQMSAILDEAEMRSVFQRALQGTSAPVRELAVENVRVEWIKYKPGINCTVCYRLTVGDSRNPRQGEQLLYGRIYADGGARGRFVKAQPAKLIRPAYGRPMMYLPPLDMLVWSFPNDRKLSGLPYLLDERCLKEESLADAVMTLWGSGWRIEAIKQEVVHYVPEHTCTVKVDVVAQREASGETRQLTLFGKTYYNGAGAETYRLMTELWDRAAQNSSGLQVARPCSYDPEHKILWQSCVTGSPLLQQQLGSRRFIDSLAEAAAAVAALHQAPLECSNKVALNDWLKKLHEVRDFLPRVLPSCETLVVPLVDHLIHSARRVRVLPPATLHGDLHLGNILTERGKAALIDLDSLANGPALIDIGSFIAALIYQASVQRVGQPQLQEMIAVFVSAYRQRVNWPAEECDLRWYVATALLVERAYRCVSRLKLGGGEVVNDVIEAAHRIGLRESGWVRS